MEAGTVIGRVTRCSTRGFAGAYPLNLDIPPSFGAFCHAPYQEEGYVIGVVYDINIEDDPLARQLASLVDVPDEQILDSQHNRQIPIEFSVLTLGYQEGEITYQILPPRPPMTLEPIRLLTEKDLIAFTDKLNFLSTISLNPSVPVDDLVVASILQAVRVRPESQRSQYLASAGRQLARNLAGDLHRLEQILSNLSLALPGVTNGK
jgi:hypothetical protein